MKGLKNINDAHMKKKFIEDISLIGHGETSGPEYPQNKKEMKRYSEEELKDIKKDYTKRKSKVEKLFKNMSKSTIFLSHNVPFNTKLDKINNPKSPRDGQHFGSIIARELIEKYQPLICIGAHMHENFGKCKIGKTTVVNAGFGSNVNVLLEIKVNKIKNLRFWNGKN